MNLQVGVKLIIQSSSGEILLIKRRGYDKLDGTWDIPGGRIEDSEDLMTALKREVSEEIGASFVGRPTIIKAQDIFPSGTGLHVVRLTYLLKEDIETIALSREHSEAMYTPLDRLIDLQLEPLLREVLAELASVSLRTDGSLL